MDLDTAFLEVMVSCPRCGAKMPVNRPVRAQHCTHCFTEAPIPEEVWGAVLRGLGSALGNVGRGGFVRMGRQSQLVTVSWTYGRGGPPCPRCASELRVDPATMSLRCHPCGAATALEPIPPWLHSFHGQLVGMVTPAEAVAGQATVVTVRCTNCGSGLSVDGSRRSVDCTYCGASNLLTDAVWQVFHPPRVMQRWWLALPAPLLPTQARKSSAPVGISVAATLFLGPFALIFTVLGLLGVLGFGAATWLFGSLAGDPSVEGGAGFGVGAAGFGIGALGFVVMLAVGLLALGGLIAVYVKAWRQHHRDTLLFDAKQEVVGTLRLLSETASGRVRVEVSCQGADGPALATPSELSRIDFDRLGGDGAFVRAWVDPSKPKHCEVKWEPSPLANP